MIKRPFLTFCLAFLLGILLLASQSTSRLLDRREDGLELRKRTDLNTLYNGVPISNFVPLGGSKDFALDLTQSATYTTSYFYGCTVVIIVDGHGVIIGHYAQEQPVPGSNGQQSCVAMTNPAVVEKKITGNLVNAQMMLDATADTRAWIITSSGTKTVGYRLIKENLEIHGLEEGNIIPYAYVATSPFNDFTKGPLGKAVVEVVPKSDGSGATINVYIQSDTPSWSGDYDSNGKLVP